MMLYPAGGYCAEYFPLIGVPTPPLGGTWPLPYPHVHLRPARIQANADVYVVGVEGRFFVGAIDVEIAARVKAAIEAEMRAVSGAVRILATRQHDATIRLRPSPSFEVTGSVGLVAIEARKDPTAEDVAAIAALCDWLNADLKES